MTITCQVDEKIERNSLFLVYNKKTKTLRYIDQIGFQSVQWIESDRFPHSSLFKDEETSDLEIILNAKSCFLSYCSKSLLNIVYSLNEFQMTKLQFIKEILSSQISSEQIGITFLDPKVQHYRIYDTYSLLETCL